MTAKLGLEVDPVLKFEWCVDVSAGRRGNRHAGGVLGDQPLSQTEAAGADRIGDCGGCSGRINGNQRLQLIMVVVINAANDVVAMVAVPVDQCFDVSGGQARGINRVEDTSVVPV